MLGNIDRKNSRFPEIPKPIAILNLKQTNTGLGLAYWTANTSQTHRQGAGGVLSAHELDFDGDVSCRRQPVDKVEPLGVNEEQVPGCRQGESDSDVT